MRWSGFLSAGALFLTEGLPFWQAAVLVTIPPLISLYSEIRVAQISAAAMVLVATMAEEEEE